MVEDRGDGQAHVAYGPVATQRHGLAVESGGDVLHHARDHGGLLLSHDQGIERGVHPADAIDASACRRLARGRRDKEHYDPQHAAHLVQRGQAGLELGHGLRDWCRMVVRANPPDLRRLVLLGPVGGDDDYGIHVG